MARNPHGHARVNPRAPEPWAICDRCGFQYNHSDLSWQYEYAGKEVVNRHLLVCPKCLDPPTPFFKTVKLPPDPKPVKNPRPPHPEEEPLDPNVPQHSVP